MDQINTLASLVGGTGSGESHTIEKRPTRSRSSQYIPKAKKVEQVRKVKPGGNGNGANKDLEALIPMGENRIVEHEDHFKGF